MDRFKFLGVGASIVDDIEFYLLNIGNISREEIEKILLSKVDEVMRLLGKQAIEKRE